MPRKPSLGPAIIRLERLSDGIDPRLVDDWTNEPLAQPNARPPQDAQDYQDAMNRRKHAMAQRIIDSALHKPEPKPIKPFVRRI